MSSATRWWMPCAWMGVKPAAARLRRGVLVTADRATNVDDPTRLETIVATIERLQHDVGPVTFPIHPRTASRLLDAQRQRLERAGVLCTEPLDYRLLLDTLATSRLVVTDSGGIQEEAAVLGVPSVVLRATTPRWEGVLAGVSELTGLDTDAIERATARLLARRGPWPRDLYGDGHTGARIAARLLDPEVIASLPLSEPTAGIAELEAVLGPIRGAA